MLEFTFELNNVSKEAVRVEIQPGCGCTTVDQTRVSIPAGASHTARVSLSLRGRIGDFHSSIRIATQLIATSDLNWSDDLPVHALIDDHWRASPQRVILERDGVGTVSVTAPTAEWQGVVTAAIGHGFEFAQTSVTTEAALETRNFRVTTKPEEFHGGNCGIGFRRGHANGAFFTVPVMIK